MNGYVMQKQFIIDVFWMKVYFLKHTHTYIYTYIHSDQWQLHEFSTEIINITFFSASNVYV